jgi:serine/threonine protein kinase
MNKMTDNVLREMLAQEIESLQLLKSCEQILHLEEAISTVNNTYIITELCPDGDLSDVIATGCLQEHEAAQIMQQVIKGYMQIYKNGIVHRDLKPSNVFLQSYNCKIADFGFSAKAARLSEPCNYNVGSPLYMAPEALLRNYYSY